MATSPGSRIPQSSVRIPLSVLPALEWVPLPSPVKQPRGTAATAIAATQAATQRDRVLLEHMPLVRMVAYRMLERLPQSVELDDLVSAGVVGLIDAYNKFDPSKEVLFRSYAAVRIRGAILDSLRGMDWAPREIRRKAREMEEATQRLTQRLGRKPQQSEVAAELGMAFASFQKLLGDGEGPGDWQPAVAAQRQLDGRGVGLRRSQSRRRSTASVHAQRAGGEIIGGGGGVAGAGAASAADVLRRRDDAEGNWPGAGAGGVASLADSHRGAGSFASATGV